MQSLRPARLRWFTIAIVAVAWSLGSLWIAPTCTQALGQSDSLLDVSVVEQIDTMVAQAIDEKKMPGCVIGFGNHSGVLWAKVYGNKQLVPKVTAMTRDSVFDMASLSKPIVTATCVMKLIEEGRLSLADRVSDHIPEFSVHGKADISVEHLLLHTSGLIPDNPLADYVGGQELAWKRICELHPVDPVGTKFKYSDVNFIVLGKLVELHVEMPLDQYAMHLIFQPLEMNDSGFNPRMEIRQRAAPTEKRDGEWIQGSVHDPRAHALGGVAGHAGLFSTFDDLSRYARMMLGNGELKRSEDQCARVLSPETIAIMTTNYPLPGGSGVRGLGWDKRTAYSINRGDRLSEKAYGHGGFTGTVLWLDPELDLYFIFLSNRLHPDGAGSVNALAGQILNVVADTLQAKSLRKP